MPEARGPRGLCERNPSLVTAALYQRVVEADIDSVWENVFDWEHLPWLHGQAFSRIELADSGDWGWRALVGFAAGGEALIELIVDRDAQRYVSRSVSGTGAPSEIWTQLDPLDADRTAIQVDFQVAPGFGASLEKIGDAYRSLYARLWDQDEEMMQIRGGKPGREVATSAALYEPAGLGPWEALRPRLPIVVVFEAQPYRIVLCEGQPIVHSAVCPHWRGPLTECAVENGVVTCPWHGYRFDVATGRSADGRSLRLRPPPSVEIDPESRVVRLVRAKGPENHHRV